MDNKLKIKKIQELLKQDRQDSMINIIDLLEMDGQESFVNTATSLEDEDQNVILAAIEALGEMPFDEKIKSFLLRMTEKPDDMIRYGALEALWGYDGEDVFRAVVRRVKDSDELVRISAVEALGNLGDIRGAEHLMDALRDEDEIVRRDAAEGLGKIGAASAIPVLQTGLWQETSSTAKVGFYTGLFLLGAEMHLKSLLNLLKDPSYIVRCSVANSVVDLVDDENEKIIVKALQSALRREPTIAARSAIEEALEEINSLKDLNE